MLDTYIIRWILDEKERQKRQHEPSRVPIDKKYEIVDQEETKEEKSDRGVLIIEM